MTCQQIPFLFFVIETPLPVILGIECESWLANVETLAFSRERWLVCNCRLLTDNGGVLVSILEVDLCYLTLSYLKADKKKKKNEELIS